MTIADKLKQIKQSTDAIKASATALTGEVQTDLTSIATELDAANPANATDLLTMLGYNSTNATELYNALLNSLDREGKRENYYNGDTTVLLPILTLDENGVYTVRSTNNDSTPFSMFRNSTVLTVPTGKYNTIYAGSSDYIGMFEGCANLMWVPDIELVAEGSYTYRCTQMFTDCTALRTVGNLNTKYCYDMYRMFDNCRNLVSIASLDTSNVVNMGNMFSGCQSLSSIPQLDTSKVTNMGGMFQNCSKLTTIPQLDTSKVTDMGYIFQSCSELSSIPQLDLSSVTEMNYGFAYCSALTTIPDLNFESATNLGDLFAFSNHIVTVGNLNTPKVYNTSYMFSSCDRLEKIASLDVRAVTNNGAMFGYNSMNALKYALFKNLGQSEANYWDFTNLTNWGVNDDKYPDARQSLIDSLITYSYDRASAGMSACTITLSAETKAQLTDDEITQIATKGYTIA